MNYKKFRIEIVSDIDYEDLIADVYFEDTIFFMLSQEEGFDNLKITFYLIQENRELLFNDFEKLLELAKNRLWDLRKA